MPNNKWLLFLVGVLVLVLVGMFTGGRSGAIRSPAQSQPSTETNVCIECHKAVTPQLVKDFQQGKMYAAGITCDSCHGSEHMSADDVEKVQIPTPQTCASCHPTQVAQFEKGKHALAWAAMKAMPTTHMQPMELMDGKKGCGGCHKIGLKTEEEIKEMRAAGEIHGL
ncbi:MAG: multiheme c-type cytochrome, partial [Candidatus Bipolaricaulota bacterium]|nr:multiheme c-type cytochrome [Candidatus Bipolaricaulota bacterium]